MEKEKKEEEGVEVEEETHLLTLGSSCWLLRNVTNWLRPARPPW